MYFKIYVTGQMVIPYSFVLLFPSNKLHWYFEGRTKSARILIKFIPALKLNIRNIDLESPELQTVYKSLDIVAEIRIRRLE